MAIRFTETEEQKKKKAGKKPPKPKKEAGAIMDIAQVALPIVASVVGTPLAGAAVSALLEGAESKIEGGSWKEALTNAVIGGGISAATGGLASGSGGAATELGKGAIVDAGKEALKQGAAEKLAGEALKETGKQAGTGFGLDLTMDALIGEGAKVGAGTKAINTALSGATQPGLGKLAGLGVDEALKAGSEGTAKQKFTEHMQELGVAAVDTYGQIKAEGAANRAAAQRQNQQAMEHMITSAGQGQFVKPKSKYYTPYGG